MIHFDADSPDTDDIDSIPPVIDESNDDLDTEELPDEEIAEDDEVDDETVK
jgi:hypothetical protein